MGLRLVAVGLLVLALASLSETYTSNPQTENTQNPQGPRQKPSQGHPGLQVKVFPGKSMSWRFPIPTPVDPPPGIEVPIIVPEAPDTIQARCLEEQVVVEVDMDLFKTNQLIDPAHITLGGCAVTEVDQHARRILFASALHSCNSMLRTTDTEVIYSFTVVYTPLPFPGTNILRTTGAVVGIDCHYPKNHNVSVGPLIPDWQPYFATKTGEDMFLFFMQLMMDDMQNVRATHEYNLGDIIYIQASVIQFYHVPLRIYVDSCVASATEDAKTPPVYAFISNHGCMNDAKLTGSRSRFLKRTNEDSLTMMLEAFRFTDSGTIWITCQLKAVPTTKPRDSMYKACSYIPGGGWAAAAGSNDVCSCCDSVCDGEEQKQSKTPQGEMWADAVVGPITINPKHKDKAHHSKTQHTKN